MMPSQRHGRCVFDAGGQQDALRRRTAALGGMHLSLTNPSGGWRGATAVHIAAGKSYPGWRSTDWSTALDFLQPSSEARLQEFSADNRYFSSAPALKPTRSRARTQSRSVHAAHP
jgi:hypothetical protein